MALPTTTKTWAVSANNLLTTNSSGAGDWQTRGKDIADWLSILVTQLLTICPSITYVGSSDGVSEDWGGTNLWVVGSTDLRNAFWGPPINAYYPSYAWWIVLQMPDGQLMMGVSRAYMQWQVQWSPTSAFVNPGGTNSNLPTAPDAVLINAHYYGYYADYAPFNLFGQGIVNSAQDHGSYNQQVQVAAALDGTAFYIQSFRDNGACMTLWFGGFDAPIPAWSADKFFYMDVSPSADRLALRNYYPPGSTHPTSSAVSGIQPFTWNNSGGGWRTVFYSSVSDADVAANDLVPIGIYSYSTTGLANGIKGNMMDVWWGQPCGGQAVYPSTGPVEFLQVGDIVLPWNVSAPSPLFSA